MFEGGLKFVLVLVPVRTSTSMTKALFMKENTDIFQVGLIELIRLN
jgi:hypothetical protein